MKKNRSPISRASVPLISDTVNIKHLDNEVGRQCSKAGGLQNAAGGPDRDGGEDLILLLKERDGGALWRAYNLTAFIHSSTGSLVHTFVSRHDGPVSDYMKSRS